MRRILIFGAACAMLAGCASQAEWARSDPRNQVYVRPAVLLFPSDVMGAACLRKRAAGVIDPKWDAYCKARGL